MSKKNPLSINVARSVLSVVVSGRLLCIGFRLRVVIAKGEYLILVNRTQFLDDGRGQILTVRLVKAE